MCLLWGKKVFLYLSQRNNVLSRVNEVADFFSQFFETIKGWQPKFVAREK